MKKILNNIGMRYDLQFLNVKYLFLPTSYRIIQIIFNLHGKNQTVIIIPRYDSAYKRQVHFIVDQT